MLLKDLIIVQSKRTDKVALPSGKGFVHFRDAHGRWICDLDIERVRCNRLGLVQHFDPVRAHDIRFVFGAVDAALHPSDLTGDDAAVRSCSSHSKDIMDY